MVNSKLYSEIKQYCEFNGIEDVEIFINKLLQKGFNIEKYGTEPKTKPKKVEVVETKPKKVEVVETKPKKVEPHKEVITNKKDKDIYGE